LIPFPIGLLVFSFISDLIFMWNGNPIWKDYVAFYTMLGGIIGAAAAAVPGLIDWATLTDRAAVRVGNWPSGVNIITLVIFIANLYLRTSSGAAWITGLPSLPFILSIVGVIGLCIAGWLGGQLVFHHRVAVDAETPVAPEQPEARRHARAA